MRKVETAKNSPTVEDRWKALQPSDPDAHVTLAGVRKMLAGLGGVEFYCTVNGYCRIQIFEFPGISFHPDGNEPHLEICTSPSVQAYLATNLIGYFVNSTSRQHYAISPPLRQAVRETDKKIKHQQKDSVPVYLVIEETSQLTPVEMKNEVS